ncbi:hypothetical protein ACOJIU_18270 (plasmid) [Carnobacterium maltaromaticum]|uniref:hypothetical protein n=1 Tax=Carnobacterium maltaromaticum TaxID=2751 RepID=UPI00344BDE0A
MVKRVSIGKAVDGKKDSMFPIKSDKQEIKDVDEKNEIKEEIELEVVNKKSITKLVTEGGKSAREQDNIRLNPILKNALFYWANVVENDKNKTDIVEMILLKEIPEEILIQGYKMTKNKKK